MIEKDRHLLKPISADPDGVRNAGRNVRLVAGPLERGFGVTLGNALRRVLLSSLPGAAVTAIQIDGVTNEFSSLEGVHEDVIDIVLNVKQLALRLHADGTRQMTLRANGPGPVTAGQIDVPADIEVLNPDHVICTLEDGASIAMRLTVRNGRGYVAAEFNRPDDAPIGLIAVDSMYSPVRRVAYDVRLDGVNPAFPYDSLVLDVETNGVVGPADAVAYASRLLQDQLQVLINLDGPREVIGTEVAWPDPTFDEVVSRRVDELDLSARSTNALRNDGIVYIGDLIQKTEGEMLRTPDFGRKALVEIREALATLGLSLGMELPETLPDIQESEDAEAFRASLPFEESLPIPESIGRAGTEPASGHDAEDLEWTQIVELCGRMNQVARRSRADAESFREGLDEFKAWARQLEGAV